MNNLSEFCTCTFTDCPNHPANHDQGCALCIAKNLDRREIPNCFFNAVDGRDHRDSYSFEEFARAVQGRA